MPKRFVSPQVHFLGMTEVDEEGLQGYLDATGNSEFMASYREARASGLSSAECLCSFYAKLCYRSLALGHNANISRVRDIRDNLVTTFDSAHGSVFEHVNLNFVAYNVSRVSTHEWVRHRIGTAFSQTSGRYCRIEDLQLVWDPILDGCQDLLEDALQKIEDTVYLMECHTGLRVPPPNTSGVTPFDYLRARDEDDLVFIERLRWVPNPDVDFTFKKKVTSAIRRIAPNGQPNEMGFSVNLRSLRHVVMVRTAAAAEREIRDIFGQVYRLAKAKMPLAFHGAKEREVDGLVEVYGMKLQPYERTD
jgi:thymidylate synthase (FAD)